MKTTRLTSHGNSVRINQCYGYCKKGPSLVTFRVLFYQKDFIRCILYSSFFMIKVDCCVDMIWARVVPPLCVYNIICCKLATYRHCDQMALQNEMKPLIPAALCMLLCCSKETDITCCCFTMLPGSIIYKLSATSYLYLMYRNCWPDH